MKAKASICISNDETLIGSLEIAKARIQIMIDKGMDNEAHMLKGLIAIADKRIAEIKSGDKPALTPDDNAKYFAEVVVDLDAINEPMIADPDVENADVSKRYTHDTIRPISHYRAEKPVDLGFVGSCMVHKGDMKIVAQMFRNLEAQNGSVAFNAPLVIAPPTYNIVDELKAEGDWDVLQKYAGFEFDDTAPKQEARTAYENTLYLERPAAICAWAIKKKPRRVIRSWPRLHVCSRAVWKTDSTTRPASRFWPRRRLWCCRRFWAAHRPWMNIKPPLRALT